MTTQELTRLLYQRYIQPTENKQETDIGVEFEMPMVNLEKRAVDYDVSHALTAAFLKAFGFHAAGTDEDGHIYSAVNTENGDVFSYDCSYQNLELSFGRERRLDAIEQRFVQYYTFIQSFLQPYGHSLTGMGINPLRKWNHNIPIQNGRYKMLYHHLQSYAKYAQQPMYFHHYPDFGMFASASQVQLDVPRSKIVQVINTFNRLEPIKALLFSNSVLLGENENLLCSRDMLWENSTHGINPHNVGMYECTLADEDELLRYLSTTAIYCVERDGYYVNFPPLKLYEYFNSQSVEGEFMDGSRTRRLTFKPEASDITYLRTFKFEDLTYRGTIEFRSACCQPVRDAMTVAAFHLGLLGQVDQLAALLENDKQLYHNGCTPSELRKILVCRQLPAFIDQDHLYDLTGQVLAICREGLEQRGNGEERYLAPLYSRLENRTNPASAMLTRLENGESLLSIIHDYAALPAGKE